MPIIEKDPWRSQYFSGVACPGDVVVPTDDETAYRLYPGYRWVYNKLRICETQGLAHAPHGIVPPQFPVFSKPIYNLRGMGAGTAILNSAAQYERAHAPGHMWMTLLDGEHVSSDCAVVNGKAQWWRHTIGRALAGSTFDYWTVLAAPHAEIERYCGEWTRRHLRGYSGCVNFETIGGRIIEAHLRFADQWPDLYGPGWVESVVALYARGRWRYNDGARRIGYSVVLFGAHGAPRAPVNRRVVAALAKAAEVSSIQITFHPDQPEVAHAMPPGGFRLAIVNCWNLEVGLTVRAQLAQMFDGACLAESSAASR